MTAGADDPLGALIRRRGTVLLDGGLATTLARRGAELSGHLWSARLLRDDPTLIRDVHVAFLEAGADVVITASYQASLEGFARIGADPPEARRLLARSVELADAARSEAGRADALVAASVGPYGAWRADGSEYRGYPGVGVGALRSFHRERLAVLAGAGADLLAIETIPAANEARVLLELLEEIDTPPAWMSFTARDEARISDGTRFAELAREAAGHPGIRAVGVNCTRPELVDGLLDELGRPGPAHRVVYPNVGDRWDAEAGRWVPREQPLTSLALGWQRRGVELIGGCCGTGPGDIAALRDALRGG